MIFTNYILTLKNIYARSETCGMPSTFFLPGTTANIGEHPEVEMFPVTGNTGNIGGMTGNIGPGIIGGQNAEFC